MASIEQPARRPEPTLARRKGEGEQRPNAGQDGGGPRSERPLGPDENTRTDGDLGRSERAYLWPRLGRSAAVAVDAPRSRAATRFRSTVAGLLLRLVRLAISVGVVGAAAAAFSEQSENFQEKCDTVGRSTRVWKRHYATRPALGQYGRRFFFVSRANGGRSIARSARTGERATGDWRLASGDERDERRTAWQRTRPAVLGRVATRPKASRPPRRQPASGEECRRTARCGDKDDSKAAERYAINAVSRFEGRLTRAVAHQPRLASTHRATRLDSTTSQLENSGAARRGGSYGRNRETQPAYGRSVPVASDNFQPDYADRLDKKVRVEKNGPPNYLTR